MRTYVAESVRAPTRTTASPGVTPCCSFSSVACCLISARISAEIALPSMIVAILVCFADRSLSLARDGLDLSRGDWRGGISGEYRLRSEDRLVAGDRRAMTRD